MSSQKKDCASKKIIEVPKVVQEPNANVTNCELEILFDTSETIICSKEEFKAEVIDETPMLVVHGSLVLKQSQAEIETVEESQVPNELPIIEESIEDVTKSKDRDTTTDKIGHEIVPMIEDIELVDFVILEFFLSVWTILVFCHLFSGLAFEKKSRADLIPRILKICS